MQKYQNNVTGRNGDVVTGGSVLITAAGSVTPSTIYSDNGSTVVANPLTTDANGYFEFFVADGTYDIRVNGTLAYTDVLIVDALTGLNGRPTNSELAASDGATKVGTTAGTVQAALDARPTSAALAATDGAEEIGTPEGTVQDALEDRGINAKAFGASPAATWDVNRDAFQAANDLAYSLGGAKVIAPPGEYEAKGIFVDSHVAFSLKDCGAVLKHPDGDTLDVIRTRVRTTTGSLVGTTLTVAASTGIEPGCMVAIRGAGGISPWQSTKLAGAILAAQTTGINLTLTTGFANSGYLQVGSEIIGYTGLSGAELTGVTRGAYGTTAADHADLAVIGVVLRLLTTVVSIAGPVVTLDPDLPPALDVTSAPVSVGSIRATVDAKIEGNRLTGGSSSTLNAVRFELARFCHANLFVNKAEAAIYFDSAWDNTYDVTAVDCSVPEGSKGSALWLFRQSHRNKGTSNISGDIWAGVYHDNRTTSATEYDGACNDNTGVVVLNAKKHTPWITNTGMLIVGGNRNVYEVLGSGVRTGVLIESDTQAYTSDGVHPTARGNRVNLALTGIYQPWVLLDAGNIVTGYYESAANGVNTGNSLTTLVSPSPGADPILGRFPDGIQSAPGISFNNETNTGFYRIAAGSMQYVAQGTLVMRLRPSGLLFTDGMNIELGTTTGTRLGQASTVKLGFWGAVPVVKQTVTGSRGGNAALASLLTAGATAGLWVDSTTA